MPRSTREWAQRKIDEAYGNMDWAIAHIGEVVDRYEELHPEISEPLLVAVDSLMQIETLLDQVKETF